MLSSELSELNRVIKDLSGGSHHDRIRAERIGGTGGDADVERLLHESPDTPSKGTLGDSLSDRGTLSGATPGASITEVTPFSPDSAMERAAQRRHGGGRVVGRDYDGAPAGVSSPAQAAPPQRTKVVMFDQRATIGAACGGATGTGEAAACFVCCQRWRLPGALPCARFWQMLRP